MPTVDDVQDALTNVIDPELGRDFVELGLIYGVEIEAEDVHVTFTLTTPACPIGPQVTEQIEEFVGELDGVGEVTSSMVFTPPWSPDKMSEDAKFALGYCAPGARPRHGAMPRPGGALPRAPSMTTDGENAACPPKRPRSRLVGGLCSPRCARPPCSRSRLLSRRPRPPRPLRPRPRGGCSSRAI